MFFFNVILLTSVSICSTSGRGMNSQLEEGQNLKLGEEVDKLSSPQEYEEMDKLHQTKLEDNLLRLFLNRPRSLEEILKETQANKDTRLKRSFYPYTTGYQMQYPQVEGANSWRTNLYPNQNPYFVSVNNLQGVSSKFNPKYAYFQNADQQKKTNKENLDNSGTAMIDRSGKEEKGAKPTWDVTEKKNQDDKPIWMTAAYRKNTQKSSRFSRASNDEPNSEVAPLPPSFRKDSQMSDKIIFLTHQYFDRNEIPSFPFHSPRAEKPGSCTWAILACCSTSSEEVNHSCFKRLGCEEHFWNLELCRSDFVQMAMEIASLFFKQNRQE